MRKEVTIEVVELKDGSFRFKVIEDGEFFSGGYAASYRDAFLEAINFARTVVEETPYAESTEPDATNK